MRGIKFFARSQQVPAVKADRSYEKIVMAGRVLEGKEGKMVHPERPECHGIRDMAEDDDKGTRP